MTTSAPTSPAPLPPRFVFPPVSPDELRTHEGGRDSWFWERLRTGYLIGSGVTHLDSADYAPPASLVLEAQERWQHQLAANPATPMRLGELEHARVQVAAFLGVNADEIALTRSATEGFGLLLHGFAWKAGDEVLFDSADHPSARLALNVLEQRHGIKAIDVGLGLTQRTDAQLVHAYQQHFTPRTRLLFLSHVNGQSGRLMPVRDIALAARAAGALTALDASQSFGALDFSITDLHVDFLAAPGHKWAGAGHGTGVAYFRREVQSHVWQTTGGFHDPDATTADDPNTPRYDRNAGQKNIPFLLGFTTALAYQSAIGRTEIALRLSRLLAQLRDGLSRLPRVNVLTPPDPSQAGPFISFTVTDQPAAELRDRLFRETGVRLGIVEADSLQILRVSPHLHNGSDDISRALSALAILTA